MYRGQRALVLRRPQWKSCLKQANAKYYEYYNITRADSEGGGGGGEGGGMGGVRREARGKGGLLARSRRSVNKRDILGGKAETHGLYLTGIK